MPTEWTLLALYWSLYLADSIQISRHRRPQWLAHFGLRAARLQALTWRFTGLFPSTWRLRTHELPFSFSPEGVSNLPTGHTLRPSDHPAQIIAYRWADLQALELRSGWIFFNGQRFCPDTRHLTYDEWRTLINQLTEAPLATREKLLSAQLSYWLRPAHLQRRLKILRAKTTTLAALNTTAALIALISTTYYLADIPALLPEALVQRIADALPIYLGFAFLAHVMAIILAFRIRKKLFRHHRCHTKDLGTKLASIALFPPQALKLRSLLGDAFFPPILPAAAALAFSPKSERAQLLFQTLSDLEWPLATPAPALANTIANWHREQLRNLLLAKLPAHNLCATQLRQAPTPNTRQSCTYCPRCHDQFTAPSSPRCPHGIALQPFPFPTHQRK